MFRFYLLLLVFVPNFATLQGLPPLTKNLLEDVQLVRKNETPILCFPFLTALIVKKSLH